MKQLKLTCLYLAFIIMAGTKVFAYNYKADGICYILNSNNQTATVTYSGYPYNNDYTGHYASSSPLKDKDIVIPSTIIQDDVEYTVTAIGDLAFYDCESNILMSSVTLPSTITSIGKLAFTRCSNLTSFTIPSSVISIGSQAFSGCSSLVSVTMERKIPISIDAYTFTNCANATLYVPAGCKAAYEAADYWKDFKEIVEIQEDNSIINFADANVKALCVSNWDTDGDGELSKDEASAVTNLKYVFKERQNITSFDELQYFTGLTNINANAFYGCSGLTRITLPISLTSIGEYSFRGCSSLTNITIPSGPIGVKTIGSGAFSYCEGLTSIIICDGVKSIGDEAFYNCSKLETIELPNSVTSIGQSAFYDCASLTSIDIPSGVTTVQYSTFNGCAKLASVTIPKGLMKIETYAFAHCAFPSIAIPSSVTSIYDFAFDDCRYLTSIDIDASNTVYDSRNGCNAIIESNTNTLIYGIKSTVIPNSIKAIGNYAFSEEVNLNSIVIPEGVESIGESAFCGCYSLTSVSIPASVMSIGDNAFSGCSGLTSVTIGNSVKSIGDNAFSYCSGLSSITIGNSVTSIGKMAFLFCSSLTSVTIPNSVTSIGQDAFWGCSGLTTVTVVSETPVCISSGVFSSRGNIVLYVPRGCVDAYKAADYWKEFKEIIEIEDEIEPTDISTLTDAIFIEPTSGLVGTTVKLDVKMKNQVTVNGCSFKLTLPEGFTLAKDSDGDIIYELSNRAKKMSVVMKDWNNGTYDFALTPSTATATISGNEDTFITLTLQIPEDVTVGNYKFKLTKNLIQTKVDNVTQDLALSDVVSTLTVEDYVIGDVNNDKNVSPADAIMILYHYFEVEQNGFNDKAADVNGDGNITPADAIEVLYRYFDSSSQCPQLLDPQ